MRGISLLLMLALAQLCLAFSPPGAARALMRSRPLKPASIAMAEDRVFELKLQLGDAGTANLRFKAREAASESVVVRYAIPFGLNVENQVREKGPCRAVCTKDGAGGEKVGAAYLTRLALPPHPLNLLWQVGDVLRYCTEYKMQLAGSGGGILTTVASFGNAAGPDFPSRQQH